MLEKLTTPDKIIRCKRKSISLIISNNGEFIVRAPFSATDERIFNFINEKSSWIISKRKEFISNSKKVLEIKNGEQISILGEKYNIILIKNGRVKTVNNQILLPCEKSKEKLINYIKKQLKSYLTTRVAEIAKICGYSYDSVSVSSAKTNWGSCSFNNKLHFTYRLVLCPLAVIDYIIVHELTHTQIKNHSKKFWRAIEKTMPSYKQAETWLKQNKQVINII